MIKFFSLSFLIFLIDAWEVGENPRKDEGLICYNCYKGKNPYFIKAYPACKKRYTYRCQFKDALCGYINYDQKDQKDRLQTCVKGAVHFEILKFGIMGCKEKEEKYNMTVMLCRGDLCNGGPNIKTVKKRLYFSPINTCPEKKTTQKD